MSRTAAPAEIVEAARAFLSWFAGVEVDPATAIYTEPGNQRVLEFTTPENGSEAEIAERTLKKSLGFSPDRFADSPGVRMTWDLEFFRSWKVATSRSIFKAKKRG